MRARDPKDKAARRCVWWEKLRALTKLCLQQVPLCGLACRVVVLLRFRRVRCARALDGGQQGGDTRKPFDCLQRTRSLVIS